MLPERNLRNLLRRASALIAAVAAVAAVSFAATPASAAPTACPPASALTNGSFETPDVAYNNYALFNQSSVPGWSTTASDGLIEIWNSPFLGVSATSGEQFAELNATQPSTLYQDIATVPGQTLRWSLSHRGRDGVDVMSVKLGAPGGSLVTQATLSDGQSWGEYSGLYLVPAGQTTTRFAFESLVGASSGNLLDNISLGGEACLAATKTVNDLNGGDVEVGDILEYTVTAENQGGNPALGVSVTDTLAPGLTFVPGSLTTDAVLTDAPDGDQGEHVAGVITARIGDGATNTTGGSIPAGESRVVTFHVSVDEGTNGDVIVNTATTSYTDSLTGSSHEATSNTLGVSVLPIADVAVSHDVTSGLEPGDSFVISITVTNSGPDAATAATLVASLPALDGVSVDDSDCAVVAGDVECDFGTLGVGSRVITITGTIPADAAASADLSVQTVADSTSTDPDITNNTDVTIAEVAAVARLNLAFELVPAGGAPVESGDELQGVFEVTNTGNVTLTDVVVSTPLFPMVVCASVLLPGESAECSSGATYTVTDDDARAGFVSTTASAEGTPPSASGLATSTAAASDAITVAALAVAPEDGDDGAGDGLAVTGIDPSAPLRAAAFILALGVLMAASSVRRRSATSRSL